MNTLEVRNLCKVYPAFTLQDVSFTVPAGSVTGLVGRNGAGKSTTLKSLLGLVHPDGGEVRFCGMDTAENEKAFKEEIGVVLGGIDFYPKKKLKTITAVTKKFYVNWDEEAYRRYMALFALDEQKRVDQLSNGMRVKYLIALALSHGARLLILDEPTSGLDPVSRDELVQLFKALVADGQRSVLFSTHITSDLEKCADAIVYIKEGKVYQAASMQEFMSTNADKGATLEDIIVTIERRAWDERAFV
ncbi:MAG: ABC transporter ATP-binding protein [Oscillospiraceae bacterium]|nr:ABC transporter ATP-binding protein [Oscillospiraceae bacterium]